jgi:hypothetical protein
MLHYTFALACSQFPIKCTAARSLPPPLPSPSPPLLLPSLILPFPPRLLPHSVRWLQRNVSLNKVSGSVTCSCSDARTFLHRLCSSPPPSDAQGTGSVHIAMNLPASATDFLDVFRGAFEREMWAEKRLPTVHVYAFSASEDPKEDIRQRVTRMLGGDASAAMEMQLHLVRDVAPKKLMVIVREWCGGGGGCAGCNASAQVCASVQLPPWVAYSAVQQPGAGDKRDRSPQSDAVARAAE